MAQGQLGIPMQVTSGFMPGENDPWNQYWQSQGYPNMTMGIPMQVPSDMVGTPFPGYGGMAPGQGQPQQSQPPQLGLSEQGWRDAAKAYMDAIHKAEKAQFDLQHPAPPKQPVPNKQQSQFAIGGSLLAGLLGGTKGVPGSGAQAAHDFGQNYLGALMPRLQADAQRQAQIDQQNYEQQFGALGLQAKQAQDEMNWALGQGQFVGQQAKEAQVQADRAQANLDKRINMALGNPTKPGQVDNARAKLKLMGVKITPEVDAYLNSVKEDLKGPYDARKFQAEQALAASIQKALSDNLTITPPIKAAIEQRVRSAEKGFDLQEGDLQYLVPDVGETPLGVKTRQNQQRLDDLAKRIASQNKVDASRLKVNDALIKKYLHDASRPYGSGGGGSGIEKALTPNQRRMLALEVLNQVAPKDKWGDRAIPAPGTVERDLFDNANADLQALMAQQAQKTTGKASGNTTSTGRKFKIIK